MGAEENVNKNAKQPRQETSAQTICAIQESLATLLNTAELVIARDSEGLLEGALLLLRCHEAALLVHPRVAKLCSGRDVAT